LGPVRWPRSSYNASLAWSERPTTKSLRVSKSISLSFNIERKKQTTMYEDSWYAFVPDSHKKDDVSAQGTKHRQKESLLKQTNVSPQPSQAVKT
jgi:hypothetical protein